MIKDLLKVGLGVALGASLLAIPAGAEETSNRHYTVRSGDTWANIASRFGTTATALQQANPATGSEIAVNEVLHLPAGVNPIPTTTTSSTTTSTSPPATTTTAPTTTTQAPQTTTTVAATTTTQATTTTTTPPSSGTFSVDFDTPAEFYDNFQTQVFFGIDQESGSHHNWIGDHDMNCGGAATQRNVQHNSHADDANLFWWCAPGGPDTGHIMTSVQTEGYAQVLFSPNRTFNNISKICWDQSMRSLPRKWTQVVVIPEALYQANGRKLNYVSPEVLPFPGIGGLPPGPMTAGPNGPDRPVDYANWDSYVLTFTNGSLDQHSRGGNDPNDWFNWGRQMYFNGIGSATNAPRYKQCITDNGNGTITHVNQMPPDHGSDAKVTRQPITLRGAIPNGQVRVIFEDDIYDSFKAGVPDPTVTDLGTWHWDNIEIS